MMYKRKIKAFTLAEIIVVLIITGIVVGMAFSVLTLVQKQMLFIENNYTKNSTANELEYQLWLDFNNYHSIRYDQVNNQLHLKTEIDSMVYSFDEKNIVKVNDTIPVNMRNITFFNEGKPVTNGIVDAIKIGVSTEDESKNLFVFKRNDATHYMNN